MTHNTLCRSLGVLLLAAMTCPSTLLAQEFELQRLIHEEVPRPYDFHIYGARPGITMTALTAIAAENDIDLDIIETKNQIATTEGVLELMQTEFKTDLKVGGPFTVSLSGTGTTGASGNVVSSMYRMISSSSDLTPSYKAVLSQMIEAFGQPSSFDDPEITGTGQNDDTYSAQWAMVYDADGGLKMSDQELSCLGSVQFSYSPPGQPSTARPNCAVEYKFMHASSRGYTIISIELVDYDLSFKDSVSANKQIQEEMERKRKERDGAKIKL